MHAAKLLWNRHQVVAPYPAGVIPVPEPIPGVSFFPGGYGLWREDITKPIPEWPLGGTMVLGHDFHSETGYYASLKRGREAAGQPTWRHLLALLERVGIAKERCFFTNAYMGLRKGDETTGEFPGRHDAQFVERCRAFLETQIQAQLPSLILSLGKWVPSLLAPLSRGLDGWRGATTFAAIDSAGPVQRGVEFSGAHSCAVVALTHPSLRPAAVRFRSYKGLKGDAAEMAMLGDV